MTISCLTLVFAAIAAQPQPKLQSELLPPTPDDWRFERIDFPLPFAPELKYQGFEELRFAPGMFKPESETYFTYIFAMKITGDATLEAAALQTLLETYFRGLCGAVAKDKKLEIDTSKISAQVRADQTEDKSARQFRATAEIVDAFVTGKPLTLNVEMMVIDVSQSDRRIFAALSSKPVDSPIGKQLRTFKDQFKERCSHEKK